MRKEAFLISPQILMITPLMMSVKNELIRGMMIISPLRSSTAAVTAGSVP